MVLESANGAFGGVGSVFFGWYTLEGNVVFFEGGFEFVRALVVEDVEFGGVAVSQ